MDVLKRRPVAKNFVVAGSVWERRMKCDEVKGGIKVFKGEENSEEAGGGDEGLEFYRRLKRNQNGGASGKRKTWNDRSPYHIRKTRSELKRFSDDSSKELDLSSDLIEESLIQIRKTRSETLIVPDEYNKELDVSVDVSEINPIQLKKTRSDSHKDPVETPKDVKSPSMSNVSQTNSPRRLWEDDDGIDADGEDEGEDDEDDLEIQVEKKSYDDKEVNLAEEKSINISEQKIKEIEKEEVKKVHQFPEKPIPNYENVNRKLSPVIDRTVIDLRRPRKVVNEEKKEKKVHQTREKPKHIFSRVNKQPSPVRSPLIDPSLRKPRPIPASKVFDRIPVTSNKLQDIVDLVMWKDVSKSSFAFGLGTFFVLLSFSAEVNLSLISGISYMGLVYVAAIYFYKSIQCSESIGVDNSKQNYIVGEEEAIIVVRGVLPYLNRFLLTLRTLFSGDPATTMKMAVLLFVLARFGSSITIWKMTKLGFFAVFIVPKICSSHSSQLTAFGKFWIKRCRDAWHSCSYKKPVAVAAFTLMWNFSSVVARIWAVFMFVVAVRYYQQSLSSKSCGEEAKKVEEDSSWTKENVCGTDVRLVGPTVVELVDEKKGR